MGKKQTYNNFTNARNNIKCPTEVRQLSYKHFQHAAAGLIYIYILCIDLPRKWIWLSLRYSNCAFQEHPYIFTKVNSLPVSTTTTAPKTDSTALPHTSTAHSTALPVTFDCKDKVPVWLAAVLAVIGLLIGWAVTWLLLSCRAHRRKKMMSTAVEMKGTVF